MAIKMIYCVENMKKNFIHECEQYIKYFLKAGQICLSFKYFVWLHRKK